MLYFLIILKKRPDETYKHTILALAKRIGNEKAVRAVATANGANYDTLSSYYWLEWRLGWLCRWVGCEAKIFGD